MWLKSEIVLQLALKYHSNEISVDHLLQLLHGQALDGFGGWLCLEDARLLGERVHTFASWCCRLLLELHVQDTTKLEASVLLHLICSQLHVGCNNCLDLARLQLLCLCNLGISCGLSQASSLHGPMLHPM